MPHYTRPEDSIEIRLYDRLRAVDSGFADAPLIVADEIARQIDALPNTGNATPPASVYGVLAPPFRQFFVEADTIDPTYGLIQRGMLVIDGSDDWRAGHVSQAIRDAAPGGTRWLMMATGYMYIEQRRQMVGYNGTLLIHLDESGHLLDDPEQIQVASAPTVSARPDFLPGHALPGHLPYLLKAIGALHARTVADKITPTGAARRRAEKQGVQRLHDYYILRVKPSAPQTMRDVGQATKRENQRREHMVRGHFRYYGPEAPLFGRTVGAIWIPDHERGNDTLGTITKDYEV